MTVRWAARRGPEARRSQTPPPKSAPAKAHSRSARPGSARPARRGGRREPSSGYPGSDTDRHGRLSGGGAPEDLLVEEPGGDDAEEAIQQGEGDEGDDQPRHGRHRLSRPEHALDDPRLSAHLRHNPPGLDTDETHRRRGHEGAEKPAVADEFALLGDER